LGFGIIVLFFLEVITMDRPLLTLIYFLVISISLIKYFKNIFKDISQRTKIYQYFLFFGFALLFHAIICGIILSFFPELNASFSPEGISFLLVNDFFIWAKPMEVFWQQVMLIILITQLHKQGLTLAQIISLCLVGFGSIHLYQILRADDIIGLGFTFFAFLGAALFPFLILRVKNGYLYNFIIHLALYDIMAIIFRVL